ncbi:MAG TPA: lipocalin-like domain-containing protein [Thermoanaerobaculia bacterium]|nr:lipocalin-like domain-containing protein [Thermoanaerobaculia bacterium]
MAKNYADTVVGCWQMVEAWNKDTPTSPPTYPWGNPPLGYWVFDPAGNASVMISINPPLSNLSPPANGWWSISIREEMAASFSNTFAYFGTYTVDTAGSTININVVADVLRQYNGTVQPRPYKLEGDYLSVGDLKTWLRKLKRVASF